MSRHNPLSAREACDDVEATLSSLREQIRDLEDEAEILHDKEWDLTTRNEQLLADLDSERTRVTLWEERYDRLINTYIDHVNRERS